MSTPQAETTSPAVDATGPPADSAPSLSLWRDWRTLRYLIGPLVLGVLTSVVILEIVFVVGLGIAIVQLFLEPQLWRRFGPQAVPLTFLRLGIFVFVVKLASAAPFKPVNERFVPAVVDSERFDIQHSYRPVSRISFTFPDQTRADQVQLPARSMAVEEAIMILEDQTGLRAGRPMGCGNTSTLLWGASSGINVRFTGKASVAVQRIPGDAEAAH